MPCLFPNGNDSRLATPFPSAHTGERGRQSNDTNRAEKKERTKKNIYGTAQRPSPTRRFQISRRFKNVAARRNTNRRGRPLCRPLAIPGAFSLFPNGNNPSLATPSALTRHCLAAARSRRGSDMPPACHSLPRRRCTTLKGAALRGNGFGLARWLHCTLGAPFRGAGSRRLTEGSPDLDYCH